MKKNDIQNDYSFEVDLYKEDYWNNLLPLFEDATLYQSWPYVFSRIKSGNVSSFVMKRSGVIVAATLIRIEKVPLLNIGMAYASFAPMWRLQGENHDFGKLLIFIRALRKEYSQKRRLYLRIKPNVFNNVNWYEDYRNQFIQERYTCKIHEHFTLILDLSPSLDEIRKNFHVKWRNNLNNAEKNGLVIRNGNAYELFELFKQMYVEMINRKAYNTDVNIDAYGKAIIGLPANLGPEVLIAEVDGKPMAGVVISKNGNVAICCLAATTNLGTTNKSSNFVQWHTIKYLKSIGIQYYDLGGCSPQKVPSTYHFKAGLCGKNPIVRQRVGIMNVCDSFLSRIAISTAEKIVPQSISLIKSFKNIGKKQRK